MTPKPPVQEPVPGQGISADPDLIDRLAKNNELWLKELDKYRAYLDFLNRFSAWKDNAEWAKNNNKPIPPPPIPPVGYSIPPDPIPPVRIPVEISAGGLIPDANGTINRYYVKGDLSRLEASWIGSKTAVLPDGTVLTLRGFTTPFGISVWWQ